MEKSIDNGSGVGWFWGVGKEGVFGGNEKRVDRGLGGIVMNVEMWVV